ncbi:hypothetical protein TNCV_1162001 [Trichonephila clavipes]|nr:hypothetical protein TNCV_1162001 [Trichonephila clavipes]
MHCVIQVPNVTLWYGVSYLLYLRQYWDGQCWLWMMLELSSNDIPYMLNWRQSDDFANKVTYQHFVEYAVLQEQCDGERYSVGNPVSLLVFPCPPSDKHTAIIRNKAEPALIRKHN